MMIAKEHSNDNDNKNNSSDNNNDDDDKASKIDRTIIESSVVPRTVVYLTLGDGDFTYSADLAVYLSSQLTTQQQRPENSTYCDVNDGSSSGSFNSSGSIELVATGIDSLDELTSKYKDTPFILQYLRRQQEDTPSLSVSIRHGVNAIVLDLDGKGPCDSSFPASSVTTTIPSDGGNDSIHEENTFTTCRIRGDHVMFHHPHMGTEDAALHGRFLAHLFYSVTVHWMKPNGGVFHVTLVQGQAERWKCLEAATRHGLVLLRQVPFVPPPPTYTTTTTVVNNNTSDDPSVGTADNPAIPNNKRPSAANSTTSASTIHHRYHCRRHQNGRSFATRRPQSISITYTFGRKVDDGLYVANSLPWQQQQQQQQPDVKTESNAVGVDKDNSPIVQSQLTQVGVPVQLPLVCPYCDKKFREERSRKCHILDRHPEHLNSDSVCTDTKSRKRVARAMARSTDRTTNTTTTPTSYPCVQCQEEDRNNNGTVRVFYSAKALAAHIQAKHRAIHTYIAPDWCHSKTVTPTCCSGWCPPNHDDGKKDRVEQGGNLDDDDVGANEECSICGWKLVGRTMLQHMRDFVPAGEAESRSFSCAFCSKSFRENRAKLQHENFCSHRPPLSVSPNAKTRYVETDLIGMSC